MFSDTGEAASLGAGADGEPLGTHRAWVGRVPGDREQRHLQQPVHGGRLQAGPAQAPARSQHARRRRADSWAGRVWVSRTNQSISSIVQHIRWNPPEYIHVLQ